MQRIFFFILIISFVACSPIRRFSKAQQSLVKDTALAGAHLGVSIYDIAANKYLYNYQGDHYFTPASNTKLFTCYAAMKYLGDSLVGARYQQLGNKLFVKPTGDPTFLHPDFDHHPLLDLLKGKGDSIYVSFPNPVDKYGPGWSWDDYAEEYMPERSAMPVFGNVVWFSQKPILPKHLTRGTIVDTSLTIGQSGIWVKPAFFAGTIKAERMGSNFSFHRKASENTFYVAAANGKFQDQEIPFITDEGNQTLAVLQSIIHKKVGRGISVIRENFNTLHSQPTDSMLKPMMHRSDNFFAEQSLLMVSNEKLGYMSDEAIIDTLLKTDLQDLPQKPVWVDGSGLSRYNLFTPQDFVTLLLKMKNEFGLERIHNILPKGNTGTLTAYYEKIGPAIFAKTGTLSGQVALSGYLHCKSGKLLLFSILVNNHNTNGRAVRRAIEKFVLGVWERN